MPVWMWLGPMGGATILGLLTLLILISGRSKPSSPPPAPRPPVSRPPVVIERPRDPRPETPPAPIDYTLPTVDYSRGPAGQRIETISREGEKRQVYVNASGEPVAHGKTEELDRTSGNKRAETWYYDGKRHGLVLTWDERGAKVSEGGYNRGRKQGPWRTFGPEGKIASEQWWYRDERHGPSTTYHANGQKARATNYVKGQRSGVAEYWDEAGKPLGRDASLQADLKSMSYDEMIDALGPPRDVKDGATGSLYVWDTGSDKYAAVWVQRAAGGGYVKGEVRGVGVGKAEIETMKLSVR